MHGQAESSADPERPLDRTWRWVKVGLNEGLSADKGPQLTAQTGTVRVSRVVVIGAEVVTNAEDVSASQPEDSSPIRERTAPGAYDCVYVPERLAADTDDWCRLSSFALARTLPAIPKLRPAPKEQARTGRIVQTPQVAFGAATAVCVLSAIALTLLAH